MKTLDDIQALLTEKQDENLQEIADCDLKIKEADEELQQAEEQKNIAEQNVDIEGYKKAKDDAWTAECKKEMFEKRKVTAQNAKLFNNQDYNEITNKIMSIAKAENEEQITRMFEPVRIIKNISQESIEMTQKAETLLKQLQSMVKANPMSEDGEGGRIYKSLPTLNIDRTAYSYYTGTIGKSESLLKLAGAFEEQNKRKFGWG